MEESKTPPQSSLPPALRLTPAKLDRIREEQAERRAQFETRGRRSPESEVQRFALAKLEACVGNVKAARQGGNEKAEAEHKRGAAEAYAELGEFGNAEQWHPDDEMKAYYRRMKEAIDKPDDDICDCQDTEIKSDKGTAHISCRFVSGFTFRNGKRVPVVQCGKCGHLNVREPSARVRKLMEKQSKRVD